MRGDDVRGLKQELGFTIVEMIVAVALLLLGALGTLAMLDTANERSRTAADRQKATAVARQVLETAKGIPYREMSATTLVTRLRQDASIAGIPGDPWRIERDGTTFTVQAQVCGLDEAADGLGSHADGGFCTESSASGSADGNPIDHKRVTVTVSWQNGAGSGTSRQSTMISARGQTDAPAVSSVRLTSPTRQPITSAATLTAAFAVTTTSDAASVIWSLDSNQQGTAVGTGRNWTFTWQLPPYDGTYDVSAQAIEPSGLGGEVRSVTVVVNRFAPAAPQNVRAARRDSVVEVRWAESRERDVIGYRVYRKSGGVTGVACEFVTEPSCIDGSPPAQTTSPVEYWVVAIDRDEHDREREGAASQPVDVNSNNPPNPPIELTLAKDSGGNSILTWTAPAIPDPDVGDVIDTYTIYRDGTALANRYASVAGTQTTWVDTATRGVVHQYWVAAVDSRYARSTLLGPVTG